MPMTRRGASRKDLTPNDPTRAAYPPDSAAEVARPAGSHRRHIGVDGYEWSLGIEPQ